MLFLVPPITKLELQQWSYSKKIWLLSYSAHLKIDVHYSSKVKNIYYFILCSHWWLEYFFFLSFFSFPISTHCSFLPLVGPHTLHFFPMQASIPPLSADLSPCPTPTTPIDLFVLRPYLSVGVFMSKPQLDLKRLALYTPCKLNLY